MNRGRPLRMPGELRRTRLGICRRTKQSTGVVKDDAHGNRLKQRGEPPLVEKRLRECPVLHRLQNLWSDATAKIDAACGEHLQRDVARLCTKGCGKHLQRLEADFAGAILSTLTDH